MIWEGKKEKDVRLSRLVDSANSPRELRDIRLSKCYCLKVE